MGDTSLAELEAEERAREGVFLAFQYPVEIPGVSNVTLLREGLNAVREHQGKEELDAVAFLKLAREKTRLLEMDKSFLERAVNEGFSGGEKKRNEVLQMLVLEPLFAVLDETDSGLDIDALKVVAEGVNALRSARSGLPGDHALSAIARLHRPRCRARAVRTGASSRPVTAQLSARARSQGLRMDRGAGDRRPPRHVAA